MSRKKKLLMNTGAGIIKQIITVICGFILPRFMLLHFGSSINGLISSIDHFLGFISLLDLGVGAVVQANLYKPLAEKDSEQISRIIKSSERFFCRLSYIFIVYFILLCAIIPSMVEFSIWFTISLILICAVSTLAQYLLGMTYQLLLNADQKTYVPLSLQIVTIVFNTIFAIILMKCGASIHTVKLVAAIVYVIRPLVQMVYVHGRYNINRKIQFSGEPIKQKWNGFSQHFAAVICQNIDVAVLTMFSTLENVSIYSVYYNVTNGVSQIVMTAATGLEALFGNMIANGEKEKLINTFSIVEWVVHAGVTLIFTVAGITIVPFVTIYTKCIADANYIAPLFGMILVMAYAAQCLRVPYFRIIKAAGHFRETQKGAYISAVLNIIITVALVSKFGLIGASSGTLVAMFYHTCYFVWYLQRNIIDRPMRYFIGFILSDCGVAVLSVFFCRDFTLSGATYLSWGILVIKVFIVVTLVTIIIHSIFYRSNIKSTVQMLKR